MCKVSIIMPAYNQERFVAQAIESVLGQTFQDWELVVVDDGSTDATAEVVLQYSDPRICYFKQENRGVSAARNLGLAKGRGEYLAFLDADDTYFPRKLEAQVKCLEHNSSAGLAYSSRITIDQHGNPLAFVQAPARSSLETIVLSFPFAPSDFMVRKRWLERIGDFEENLVINEDRDLYIRLALAGCRFQRVNGFLATRRLDTERVVKNLPERMKDMLRALDTGFGDPRCPEHVRTVADFAHRNIYLAWAYQSAIQDEAALAQTYFREVLHYDPSYDLRGKDGLVNFLIHSATRDGGDHEERLHRVFTHLPEEMGQDSRLREWAIGRGYLVKGTRDILWGRVEQGEANMTRAMEIGAIIDESFIQALTEQLLLYEAHFESSPEQDTLPQTLLHLQSQLPRQKYKRLVACYSINQAFRRYRSEEYHEVPSLVKMAAVNSPRYLFNRGVWSTLLRSVVRNSNLPTGASSSR
jgi:glycosyltransferase involved in cell wall biosynthesis